MIFIFTSHLLEALGGQACYSVSGTDCCHIDHEKDKYNITSFNTIYVLFKFYVSTKLFFSELIFC